MLISIRRVSGQIEIYEICEIPDGFFMHRGTRMESINQVEEGDWLVEVPKTNCAW